MKAKTHRFGQPVTMAVIEVTEGQEEFRIEKIEVMNGTVSGKAHPLVR